MSPKAVSVIEGREVTGNEGISRRYLHAYNSGIIFHVGFTKASRYIISSSVPENANQLTVKK